MSDSKLKENNEALHFLHDLLNHTHGLKLYLESRNGQMDQSGLEVIYNEIAALENQISKQFNRLKDNGPYRFTDLIETCKMQFEIYQLNVDLVVEVSQCELAPIEFSCDEQIFERLIKNISKNIYLWSRPEGKINCHISEVGEKIQITLSNEIDQHSDLNKASNGIGLLSMKRLASENGIVFQSYLAEKKWFTKILIDKLGERAQNIAC
ncbi:hypothetical protein M902_3121 [Bacteriovorax sp. BAL6_X]|uniref:hypothetical protein n=1 Tax=Bacteriovorax sp. BAL6_X TaxID=1201290 RepID=UPI000385B0D6|nr:hypothetical protein [Bacteriovorax sp. BAL6_X]EPZ50673.1 hypothetical protein M902_3121 [Bacteriovorax sp. BAL6_X]